MNYIHDPVRLAALESTTLLDSPAEESFDRVSRLASLTLKVPVVILSLVTGERQFFKSAVGLNSPLAEERETALTHSFCKWVVEENNTFVVPDSHLEERLLGNLAISEMGVRAYLGAPVTIGNGHVLGAFAVIDGAVREWTDQDRVVVEEYARIAADEIELRLKAAAEGLAAQQLSESRERSQLLLQSTGEGIYGLNHEGACTFANQACLDLLGYGDEAELYGRNMHELIHHSTEDGRPIAQIDCRIFQVLEKAESATVEDEVYWRKDGTSIPVEYRAFPLMSNGKAVGAVVTFHDIAERLQTMETVNLARLSAVEADRQKTQFLANMSHEIRTPMNAILGFCELLEAKVESEKAKQYLRVIQSSSESLLELINDILDLSKVESGHVELNKEVLALKELVGSVVDVLRQMATEKELSLRIDLSDDLPEFVVLDRARFRQVLLNLVSNAIKFTDKGSVTVGCECIRNSADDKVDLHLFVEDTGSGIASDQLDRIFKPFHQIDEEREDAVLRGTGLGLSISLRLASLMGGNITVESQPCEGSRFLFLLEGVEVSAPPTEPAGECIAGETDLDFLKSSHILVADDNSYNRQLLREMFDGSEHRLSEAHNGKEAVESATDDLPDVILMDIRMPVLDGRKALQVLRANQHTRDIPVLAVTASSLMNQEAQLRKTFDGYLRKPFSRADLYRELSLVIPVSDKLGESRIGGPGNGGFQSLVDSIGPGPWKSLTESLRALQGDAWKRVSSSFAVGATVEFATCLGRLGDVHECAAVVGYSEQVRLAAESYSISILENLLMQFPVLIASLEERQVPSIDS